MMQSVSENKWTCMGRKKKYRKSETQQASDMYKWSLDFLPLLTHFSIPFSSFHAWRQCKLCFKVAPRLPPLQDCHLLAATWVAARQREKERERAMRQLQMELLDSMSQRMDNAAARREGGERQSLCPENALSFPPNKHEHDHVWQSLNEH